MSRPAQHVDVASTAVLNITQPPSGIQTDGFPSHSKFAAAWANWLFRYLGEWERELDQACLRAAHWLDPSAPFRVDAASLGVTLPLASGLANLSPNSGSEYYLEGRYVDLSTAAIAVKYSGAFTLAPSTIYYMHGRPDPAGGGSATGELLLSTNATEPGYTALTVITTGPTEVTSNTQLVGSDRVVARDTTFNGGVVMAGAVSKTGASPMSISSDLNLSGRVLGTFNSAVDFFDITQSGSGYAIDVNKTGTGTTMRVQKTAGVGVAFQVYGGPSSVACQIEGASGQGGLEVTGGTGATWAARVLGTGVGGALHVLGGGAGGTALTVLANGGNTAAASFTGSGTSTAVTMTGGGGASAVTLAVTGGFGSGSTALTATAGNLSGTAISATGGAGTSSIAVFANGSAGVGVDARSNSNYGIIVRGDTTSPTFGQLRIIGANADPSTSEDGALSYHDGMHQLRVGRAAGTFRSFFTRGPGSALYAVGESIGVTFSVSAGFADTVSAIALDADGNGYYGLAAGARVLVRVTLSARNNSAVAQTLNLRLIEVTNGGATIATRAGAGAGSAAGYYLGHAVTDYQGQICWTTSFVPSGEGDLTVKLQGQAQSGTIILRDVCITIMGTH